MIRGSRTAWCGQMSETTGKRWVRSWAGFEISVDRWEEWEQLWDRDVAHGVKMSSFKQANNAGLLVVLDPEVYRSRTHWFRMMMRVFWKPAGVLAADLLLIASLFVGRLRLIQWCNRPKLDLIRFLLLDKSSECRGRRNNKDITVFLSCFGWILSLPSADQILLSIYNFSQLNFEKKTSQDNPEKLQDCLCFVLFRIFMYWSQMRVHKVAIKGVGYCFWKVWFYVNPPVWTGRGLYGSQSLDRITFA